MATAVVVLTMLTMAPKNAAAAPFEGSIPDNAFIDNRGELKQFSTTYDEWFSAQRKPVHRVRAIVEESLILLLGTLYYVVDPLSNRRDWDNPAYSDRLTLRAASFDDNLNTTNHLLHPIAGALTYSLARSNGLGAPEAFLHAAISSFVFETLLEVHDKPSWNDMIYTPIGGTAIGEFFYRLGDYLNSAPAKENLGQAIAANTIGLERRLHARADGEIGPTSMPPDNLGLSSAYWHRFMFASQTSLVHNDLGENGALFGLLASAELVAMPGYLLPGHFARTFGSGNFTEMSLRLGIGSSGLDDIAFRSSATLLGYYTQHYDSIPRGIHGIAGMIGLNTALDFGATKILGRRDQLSTAHLFGPAANLWLADGDFLARFSGDVHLDFASLRSLAFDRWRQQFSTEGTRFVLSDQGYVFDLGVSFRARAELDWRWMDLVLNMAYGQYGSLDGDDRHQELVTKDLHGTEQVLELGATLGLQHDASPLYVRLGGTELRRWSSFGIVREHRYDRTATLTVGARF